MSADELNRTLASEAPALSRMLSDSGRSLVFPHGIPYQAGQAKHAEINATVGQLTDGHGNPMVLEALSKHLADVDPKLAWLYSPGSGPTGLRKKWLKRQLALAGGPAVSTSLPFATHGLAHAIALVAALVADPELDLIVPEPAWENYGLLFRVAGGARMLRYPFFNEAGEFNLDGLLRCLDQVRSKAVVVLNFPNNPTGYVPTTAEMRHIAHVLADRKGPMVVLCDDAYQGWVYDEDRERRSPFWELAKVANPEHMVPMKVDGATKELAFFSARVGFLTTTLTGAAEAALASKLNCHVRGTVGCPPGPSMALMDRLLDEPSAVAEFEARRLMMARRCEVMRQALDGLESPRLRPLPFHGAFFALLRYDGDVEQLRRTLLADYSTGVISFPGSNAFRLAYCSLSEQAIPDLVDRVQQAVGS